MSVLLTVPLGPHPPSSGAEEKSPYATRVLAASVLRLVAQQYGDKYTALRPRKSWHRFFESLLISGITSTLTKTLYSPPIPVASGPSTAITPAGRYEGAILGLGALGPNTVSSTLLNPDGVTSQRVDSLAGELYTGKNRGIVKAWIKACGTVLGPRPDPLPAIEWSAVGTEAERLFGAYLTKGMEKKHAWMASELVRMRRAGEI